MPTMKFTLESKKSSSRLRQSKKSSGLNTVAINQITTTNIHNRPLSNGRKSGTTPTSSMTGNYQSSSTRNKSQSGGYINNENLGIRKNCSPDPVDSKMHLRHHINEKLGGNYVSPMNNNPFRGDNNFSQKNR